MFSDFREFVSNEIEPVEDSGYTWDEWRAQEYISPIDSNLVKALEPVSKNALISFGVAISIWIHRSLESQKKAELFLSFLEVAAASSLEDPVLLDFEVDVDSWRGPGLGPFAVCMTSVVRTVHDLSNMHIMAEQIHYLKAVFCHIRPHTTNFETWFGNCVEWLVDYQLTEDLIPVGYTPKFFDTLDFEGYPLPLTVYIPGKQQAKTDREAAFNAQRAAISADNPFLSSSA